MAVAGNPVWSWASWILVWVLVNHRSILGSSGEANSKSDFEEHEEDEESSGHEVKREDASNHILGVLPGIGDDVGVNVFPSVGAAVNLGELAYVLPEVVVVIAESVHVGIHNKNEKSLEGHEQDHSVADSLMESFEAFSPVEPKENDGADQEDNGHSIEDPVKGSDESVLGATADCIRDGAPDPSSGVSDILALKLPVDDISCPECVRYVPLHGSGISDFLVVSRKALKSVPDSGGLLDVVFIDSETGVNVPSVDSLLRVRINGALMVESCDLKRVEIGILVGSVVLSKKAGSVTNGEGGVRSSSDGLRVSENELIVERHDSEAEVLSLLGLGKRRELDISDGALVSVLVLGVTDGVVGLLFTARGGSLWASSFTG